MDTPPSPRGEPVRALCVSAPDRSWPDLERFLEERGAACERASSFHQAEHLLLESPQDLVLLDADHAEGDLPSFMYFCRQRQPGLPIVALHKGVMGGRSTALIRLGAFDAFPVDMDRWDTGIFLERALAQARIVKRLLHLSRTDHLTGLYNQRFLYESLERELRRAKRVGRNLSVALLDMDNFKSFNDTYGHMEGDRTLSALGRILAGSIREGQDSAYRYGGDEFMLLLPETGVEEALTIVQRVLDSVKRDSPRPFSFSVGLTGGETHPNAAAVMHTVDIAMYQAKQGGGDRVCILGRPAAGPVL